MSKEITKVLACNNERISIPNDRYQYDKDIAEDQILLRVDIAESKTPNESSSSSLIKDLDQMIKLKSISQISREEHTNDLDPNYGAQQTRKLKIYIYIYIYLFIYLFFNCFS